MKTENMSGMNDPISYSSIKVSQEEIDAGLERLSVLMQGNTGKVREIVFLFVNETPVLFEQIGRAIRNLKTREAVRVIHRLKPRYGYIGLDKMMDAFSQWEVNLTMDREDAHLETLQNYQRANDLVMAALKSSHYYTEHGSGHVNPATPQKLILIAEDDEVNAKIFELLITEAGLKVAIAIDGMQAVQLTHEKLPDLIFMDVHMPFFNGLYAIRELRSKGVTCPIVALSASTRSDEQENSIAAGANDFLVKPAKRDAIMAMLSKHLK